MLARGRRIGLAEAVEDVRKELGIDARAGAGHDDLGAPARAPQLYVHAPAGGRELRQWSPALVSSSFACAAFSKSQRSKAGHGSLSARCMSLWISFRCSL